MSSAVKSDIRGRIKNCVGENPSLPRDISGDNEVFRSTQMMFLPVFIPQPDGDPGQIPTRSNAWLETRTTESIEAILS